MITSLETTITAQFYDLDPMGVVWHGNYARYLEEARCKLLDAIGYNYTEMEQSGYKWPIVDMQIKYVRPIRFSQEIIVNVTLVETANRLKINYTLRDKLSGEVVTKATTTQVAVHIKTGELCLESPSVLTDKIRLTP